ncbi:MAG: hypothetical protein IPM35_39385 [Myxococcales bacterium]|nr:hypothetical protein [Myxococcales bacterium]
MAPSSTWNSFITPRLVSQPQPAIFSGAPPPPPIRLPSAPATPPPAPVPLLNGPAWNLKRASPALFTSTICASMGALKEMVGSGRFAPLTRVLAFMPRSCLPLPKLWRSARRGSAPGSSSFTCGAALGPVSALASGVGAGAGPPGDCATAGAGLVSSGVSLALFLDPTCAS